MIPVESITSMYNINSKTSMLRSSLSDYMVILVSPHILVSGTITINGEGADDAAK